MNKSLRIVTLLAVLTVAAASQAVSLNYAGNGPLNGSTTTTLGVADDFGFVKSVTAGSTITLSDASGLNGLVLSVPGLSGNMLFSGLSTATGFGKYTGFGGTVVAVTTINTVSYGVFAQGAINPVPEPATMAAVGLGAFGLIRRRRKA